MIKLIDILQEIADSPYQTMSPHVEDRPFEKVVDYDFKSDTGREYYVRFTSTWQGRSKNKEQKYNWATELTFFPKEHRQVGDPQEVGGENFGRILATVGVTLKDYIKKYKPEYVYWKGIKADAEDKSDVTKRQRIYNTLLGRAATTIAGYKARIGDKVSWLIYDGAIPMEDTADMFKYPEEPSHYDEKQAQAKASRFNLAR
jgi:hypothetical protein